MPISKTQHKEGETSAALKVCRPVPGRRILYLSLICSSLKAARLRSPLIFAYPHIHRRTHTNTHTRQILDRRSSTLPLGFLPFSSSCFSPCRVCVCLAVPTHLTLLHRHSQNWMQKGGQTYLARKVVLLSPPRIAEPASGNSLSRRSIRKGEKAGVKTHHRNTLLD